MFIMENGRQVLNYWMEGLTLSWDITACLIFYCFLLFLSPVSTNTYLELWVLYILGSTNYTLNKKCLMILWVLYLDLLAIRSLSTTMISSTSSIINLISVQIPKTRRRRHMTKLLLGTKSLKL